LIEALKEGVIETISSDHTPLASEKKAREIDQVPFGIASIETVLPLCVEALIAPGHLTWLQLIQKLTIGPAKLLKQEATKTLAPGTIADLTVIDPQATYQIDLNRSRSLGRNSPFHGRPATGQVQVTIEGGVVKYEC
jgi:dihydroorotase